jgi:outer membrane protein
MYKRSLIALALSAWLPPHSAGANDLLDAYHQAQAQDTTLQAAEHQRDAAVEARPQALAAFLPQLDANANLTREKLSADGEQTAGATPGAAAPSSGGVFFGNTSTYALTLNQQVWSFQAFHQLAEANLQKAQAEAVYQSAEQGLILRVAQAYFAVLSAADTLRTNQLERGAYGELLRQAQKRVEAGLSPQTDVKEAQSFYDISAEGVIDAESALDDAQRALAEITAGAPRAVTQLREQIPLALPEPAAPEQWVGSALDDNYDLRAADLQAQAAQRDISVNRARSWPTLSLQGSLSKFDYDPQLGTDQRVNAVGVVMDWPLFQGGRVASQVRQARATWEQLKAQYEGSRRAVERQTRAAFRGVVAGAEKVRSDRQAVQSNQAAVDASRTGHELGTRNEFDLLNAQTNYYGALRSFYQSRYDYLTQVLTLKQLAGRLGEADLAAIDAQLGDERTPPPPGAASALSGTLSADTPAAPIAQ